MEGGNEAVKDRDKEKRSREKSENQTAGGWCAPAALPTSFFLFILSSLSFSFSLSSLRLWHDQEAVLCGSPASMCQLARVAVHGMAISVLMLVKRTRLRHQGWAGYIQPTHTNACKHTHTRSKTLVPFTVGDVPLPQLQMNLILCLISSVGSSSMSPKACTGQSVVQLLYILSSIIFVLIPDGYTMTQIRACALPQCYKFLEFRTTKYLPLGVHQMQKHTKCSRSWYSDSDPMLHSCCIGFTVKCCWWGGKQAMLPVVTTNGTDGNFSKLYLPLSWTQPVTIPSRAINI